MKQMEILELLKEMLDTERYRHTLGVVECARELAGLYKVDDRQAELAALLHDCARGYSGCELLAMAEQQGLSVDELEREIPELLHGRVGAYLATVRFGVQDPAVLQAIELHTLGAREMTALDKVIFIADMVEPGRSFPGVQKLRAIARQNLDEGMLKCLDATITYVLEKKQYIHPQSIIARNAILLKMR
jgi:predicted HD superfamily hydrolase involved in NAD metabolism